MLVLNHNAMQDFRFSQRWRWNSWFSGLLRRVVWAVGYQRFGGHGWTSETLVCNRPRLPVLL